MSKEDDEIKGFKRRNYEERADLFGGHKFSDIGQLIAFIAFLIIWILDSFVFHFSTFLVNYIPNYARGSIASIILVIAGFLAYTAHDMVFKEERDQPEVLSTSVFSCCRHPMYLGAILLYFGLIVSTLSLMSLGFFVIVTIFYNYIASYEEKILLQRFGDDYRLYQQKVSKWLPGIKLLKRKKKQIS